MTQTKWHKPIKPLNAPKYNPFERDRRRQKASFFGLLSIKSLAIIIVAILALALLWYFNSYKKTLSEIPVISAPSSLLKTRPESENTTNIPHQEKTIYQSIEKHNKKETSEKLVEAPEDPMNQALSLNEKFFDRTSPVSDKQNPSDSTNQGHGQEAALFTTCPIPLEGESLPKKVVGNTTHFQILYKGFKTREAAENTWKKMIDQAPNNSDLQKYDVHFKRVDLGGKRGVEHRIQIGMFTELEKAHEVCKSLQQKCTIIEHQGN